MSKTIKLLSCSLLVLTLVGCYNKGEIKTNIQREYDKGREISQRKGDICFYLGSVKFPYTDEPVLADDTQWVLWNKEKLTKTLPLFTEVGLLTRTPVEGQPGLYHYDLTELGREYQFLYPQRQPSGRIIYNNAFCYGIKKLTEVTDITEKTIQGNSGSATRTKVYVKFNYQLLDIPAWATHFKTQLDVMYRQSYVKEEGSNYLGSVTLKKGKGGNLYDDGHIGPLILQPTGKLLDEK